MSEQTSFRIGDLIKFKQADWDETYELFTKPDRDKESEQYRFGQFLRTHSNKFHISGFHNENQNISLKEVDDAMFSHEGIPYQWMISRFEYIQTKHRTKIDNRTQWRRIIPR